MPKTSIRLARELDHLAIEQSSDDTATLSRCWDNNSRPHDTADKLGVPPVLYAKMCGLAPVDDCATSMAVLGPVEYREPSSTCNAFLMKGAMFMFRLKPMKDVIDGWDYPAISIGF